MNAKKELVDKLIKIHLKVDWAKINYRNKVIVLKRGSNKEDYDNFLKALDFDYDAGYGSQKLFGNVVFESGTWLSRHVYDGAECWVYNRCPQIPVACK